MPTDSSYYDYEEGKRRISAWLADIRSTDWSPTPEVRRLQSLIEDLEAMASRLGEQQWLFLEAAHDTEPPKEIDVTGNAFDADFSNQGRYAALRHRLSELADTARQQISDLPNSRQRPEVPQAAELLLHLRYECQLPPPTVYHTGDFVIDFDEICKAAGVRLSHYRLRNILLEVLETFDRHIAPPQLARMLVPLSSSKSDARD